MLRRTFLKSAVAGSIARRSGVLGAWLGPKDRAFAHTAEDLRCSYRIDPRGIETAPRLSWRMQSIEKRRGLRQSAYQVLVARSSAHLKSDHGDLWNSGVVESGQATQVPYAGVRLEPHQVCYWKVRVRDERSRWSAWSARALWSMGIPEPSLWHGTWIGGVAASGAESRAPDPWLRKRISLTGHPERCVVYVASIGYHELYVNGRKIGEQVLAPSVSNLKHRVRYVTYEIADALQPGDNMIGLWLGTSWSIFPAYSETRRPGVPLAKVQGHVWLADGTTQEIISDASWKTMPSANTLLGTWNVHDFGGERYDARRAVLDWAEASMDDSAWSPAALHELDLLLSADESEGNVLDRPIHAREIVAVGDGAYRVDMGINFAGWFEIGLSAAPGAEVELQTSERIDEVCSFAQRSVYVMGPEGHGVFRNRFNYMCGRWITVKGVNAKPALEEIGGWNIRTAYAPTAEFSCDQPLLNQIEQTTRWTFENLTLGNYVVDCPHRERTGYGDAEESMRMCVNNYAMGAFLSQWAVDWCDVQTADGDIPHSAPTEIGGGGPAWGALCVTLPWRMYQRYGDTRVLRQGLPTMERWLAFMETHVEDDMLVRWGSKWGFLGDWQWPNFSVERSAWEKKGKALGDTPESLFFNNCYWVHSLRTVANVAEALGDPPRAERYRARADRISSKLHARFFQPADSSYVNGSPAYLAIALRAQITPELHQADVWKRLEHEIMVHRAGHIWAGIIGGVVLMDLLLDHRRDDLIYAMASKVDFPGWGQMLKLGHTTFTEGWGGTGSGLHSSFLYIGSWFLEGLAGIRQPTAGFQQFEVDPAIDLIAGPRQAKGRTDTEFGRVQSEWKREGDLVWLGVSIPPNTSCSLNLRQCIAASLKESGNPVRAVSGVAVLSTNATSTMLQLQPGEYSFQFKVSPL